MLVERYDSRDRCASKIRSPGARDANQERLDPAAAQRRERSAEAEDVGVEVAEDDERAPLRGARLK